MLTLLAQATQQFNDTISLNPVNAGYQITSANTLINGLLGVFLAISGFLAFCYLLWGGIIWITGGGDKSKIELARATITQAIIGIALIAMMIAFFGILTDFLGIREKVNLAGFGQSSGTGGGGGSGGGGGTATCTTGNIGQSYNDGGAGGYCSGGGAAMVRCVGAGVGPSGFNYPHFEPCSCITGTLLPGYSTSGCQ